MVSRNSFKEQNQCNESKEGSKESNFSKKCFLMFNFPVHYYYSYAFSFLSLHFPTAHSNPATLYINISPCLLAVELKSEPTSPPQPNLTYFSIHIFDWFLHLFLIHLLLAFNSCSMYRLLVQMLRYIFHLHSRFSELRRKVQVAATSILYVPFTQFSLLLIVRLFKSHSLFLLPYCPFSIQCINIWLWSLHLPFTLGQL